jgi:4-diphosphocytidyl-2-C-methyl-D-erythritol kinase
LDSIRIRAYGKINIGLDVIKKRDDGYHEVKMIMQTVNLFDKLEIYKTNVPKIKISTNLFYIPNDENNLVYKAAKLLFDEFHITNGIRINLYKHIPVAAGMAGGSSDAAATLYAVNKLFNLGLTNQELMERGVKIGADVPYCLMKGTVLATGIGEKLTRLPAMPNCYVVIVKPAFSISTKKVYQSLNIDEIERHPDIDGIIQAIERNDLYTIASKMENVLESVTVKKYPVLDEIKNIMKNYGALGSVMSGSGPTVFGLFDDIRKAKTVIKVIKDLKLAKQFYLTDMLNINAKKGGF